MVTLLDDQDSDLFYSSLFEYNPDMVIFMDIHGIIARVNRGFSETLGYPAEEVESTPLHPLFPTTEISTYRKLFKQALTGEASKTYTTLMHKNGHSISIRLNLMPAIVENKVIGVFALATDITERKRAEELNNYLAHHDYLTGLPNQRFFYKRLEQRLIISKALQQPLTVMLLDLDRFKYINDSLGHSIGDALLKKVSKRLELCLKEEDVLSRAGGDEFAILLPNIGNTDEAVGYAKTLIESLEQPFHIEKYELFITASIGISIFPDDGKDSETLIKHADLALYKAKANGKNTYQVFTSSINTETYKLFALESDLRRAFELNQFELFYQPQVCSTTREIIGAEALIRWNHPEWGMVSPDEFLPLAEEIGMVIEIGRWVKETACIQNKAWQDAGLPVIPVSINLSAQRFLEKDLIVNLKRVLSETNLDPKYLQVEVVETYLLENEKVVISRLDELKKIGIKVLLDDFGTGYSSLSYLKQFRGKIDTLKIDRSFISDLSRTDAESSNFITKTIIDLAHHLKMDVIAEGVETVEQLEILKEYNCHSIQGYLFSKPVPADQFVQLLKKRKIELPYETWGRFSLFHF